MNIWQRSYTRKSSDKYGRGEIIRFFASLSLLFLLSLVLAVLFGSTSTGIREARA